MEMMHELHRTEELLQKSLKELNDKGDLNNQTLDLLGKTLDAVKDLCEIKEKENPSYGSRQGGMWTAEGSYGRMMPMYGRRDGDGDGRYYEGYRGYEGMGYGRDGSYGRDSYGRNDGSYGRNDGYGNNSYGHNQDIIESLKRDLQNASSEQEREYIRSMIRKYEK